MSLIRDRRHGRRWWLAIVALASMAAHDRTAAQGRAPQTSARPLRLGAFFWHDSPNDTAAFEGIRAALADVGRPHELLVERAGEDLDEAERILGSFRERGVDLLFAMGTQAALLAAEHIRETPIVFTAVTHPIESGVVTAWEGSGRNIAGNSNWIPPETILRVFRLTVPGLRRLGMLRSADSVVSAAELGSMRSYLERQPADGLEILDVVAESATDLTRAVDQLVAEGVEAIWIPIDRMVYENTATVFRAARRHGIPLVSSSLRGTETGATSGVVVDYVMLGQRAAALALGIVGQGESPGSIPVGTMHGYRVIVNVEAARQSGYELPLPLLLLADVLLERIAAP